MKISASILIAGVLIAGAVYAGLTDARCTYMKGCVEMLQRPGQSEESILADEANCAFRYRG